MYYKKVVTCHMKDRLYGLTAPTRGDLIDKIKKVYPQTKEGDVSVWIDSKIVRLEYDAYHKVWCVRHIY